MGQEPMSDSCTDSLTGRLIHAYELGLLSDDEAERFEMHLMQCDHCVSLLKNSALRTDLFRSDSQVRADKLRQYLWPNVPLPFRPAVALLLVLLLVYPAYRGLRQSGAVDIVAVKEIGLVDSRTVGIESTTLAAEESAVLTFVYSQYRPGFTVAVRIIDESGRLLYENTTFEGFDQFQTARLFLPGKIFQPGEYRLQVGPAGVTAAGEIEEYRFRIAR
jgi:hypothetical protein